MSIYEYCHNPYHFTTLVTKTNHKIQVVFYRDEITGKKYVYVEQEFFPKHKRDCDFDWDNFELTKEQKEIIRNWNTKECLEYFEKEGHSIVSGDDVIATVKLLEGNKIEAKNKFSHSTRVFNFDWKSQDGFLTRKIKNSIIKWAEKENQHWKLLINEWGKHGC